MTPLAAARAERRRVDELELLVRRLTAEVARLGHGHQPAGGGAAAGTVEPARAGLRSLLTGADPATVRAQTAALVDWLAAVFLRFPDAVLPSCWAWHPHVVEELRWLRATHAAAFDPQRGSWARVAEWHDRHRPGVARRVAAAVGGCELALHAPGGKAAGPPRAVPLADDAVDVTAAWAATGRTPAPTSAQLTAADTAHSARPRPGARATRPGGAR